MSANSELEKRIGYSFRDVSLLETALTHASLQGKDADNERLEFLGDRVLGLVVAALLYEAFPHESEGALAKRHTALVQRAMLAAVAADIDIAARLRLSGGETKTGGLRKEAILADAVEALIGAVFIDGGYDAAGKMISKLWRDKLQSHITPPEDPKTLLQEWAQGRGRGLPEYSVLSRTGADHAPLFEISVTVTGLGTATATAASKRAAEKEAARLLLQQAESAT